jgi:hypothetical protein
VGGSGNNIRPPRQIFKKLINKNAMNLKIGTPQANFQKLVKKCQKTHNRGPPAVLSGKP